MKRRMVGAVSFSAMTLCLTLSVKIIVYLDHGVEMFNQIINLTGCDICNEKHDGECPMHGPLHSLRKLVSAGQSHSPLENGSILKFPDEVCLCTSSIPCVGYGVCARKRIPAGTWIGPYEGKLVRPEDIKADTETEYMWEVKCKYVPQ